MSKANITVSPLTGFRSLRVLNVFSSLLLGLKMLPESRNVTYVEFLASYKDKTDEEKETDLRHALQFVELDEEEVNALVHFASDPNGIPYSSANVKNLSADEIFEICIAVLMEFSKIKITLVSEDEKKKSLTSRSILEGNT